MTYDLMIHNGNIIDGTRAAARSGDIAVRDGSVTGPLRYSEGLVYMVSTIESA
jgi:adenine deaminase